jgi:hypothetical protein
VEIISDRIEVAEFRARPTFKILNVNEAQIQIVERKIVDPNRRERAGTLDYPLSAHGGRYGKRFAGNAARMTILITGSR